MFKSLKGLDDLKEMSFPSSGGVPERRGGSSVFFFTIGTTVSTDYNSKYFKFSDLIVPLRGL